MTETPAKKPFDAETLMPCPFTGEKPTHGLCKKRSCQLHGDEYQDYFVKSKSCYIQAETKDQAFFRWNTRTLL